MTHEDKRKHFIAHARKGMKMQVVDACKGVAVVPEVPGAAVVGVTPPHQLLHAVDSVAPAFLRLGSMVTK